MRSSFKKNILFLIKIVFSCSLLFVIFKSLDFSKTIELLLKIDIFFFSLGVASLLLQILFANYRWKFVLDKLHYQITFSETIRYLWIGLFFNQALPSSIGGDAVRGYYLKRKKNSIKDAAIGVVLDRLFGLMGLVLLVSSLTPFLFNRLININFHYELFILIGLLICIFFLLIFFDSFRLNSLNSKFINLFRSLSSIFRMTLFSFHPGLMLIFLSISIHFISVIAVMFLSFGLGLEIEFIGILIIIPIVTLFSLVPISVAGWGVREGVMVLGLGLLNIQPEESLALSISYGLLMLIIALPGGLIWLLNGTSYIKK